MSFECMNKLIMIFITFHIFIVLSEDDETKWSFDNPNNDRVQSLFIIYYESPYEDEDKTSFIF